MSPRLFVYCLSSVARPREAARLAHVAYLRSLAGRGVLVAGGPFRGGGGAVVCVAAADLDDAESIARADPLVVFGFMVYQLREIDRVEPLAHVGT